MSVPDIIYLEDMQWDTTYAGCKPAIQLNVEGKKIIINILQIKDMYRKIMMNEIKPLVDEIHDNINRKGQTL